MAAFATQSGQIIQFDRLTVDHINIEDIAHHLSKIQRYNGALPINVTYSVAEHCINLANWFLSKGATDYWRWDVFAKYALLHDATEAYLGDLVPGVKTNDYRQLENKVNNIISNKFQLDDIWTIVHDGVISADKRIVIDEIETICPDKLELYKQYNKNEKLDCHIMYNNHPATVKQCYLTMCKKLGVV